LHSNGFALPKEYRLTMADASEKSAVFLSKGNFHNFILFSSLTSVHLLTMVIASLSFDRVDILFAN
jgi:hypothetical protein